MRLLRSLKTLARNDRCNQGVGTKLPGQSLIEFALLLPVFLLAVVVVFDLGRAIYYYSAIHNAAREGARYGVIYPDDVAGMRNKAVDYAIGLGLNVANVTAGLGTSEVVGGFPNPTVRVTVTYCFNPATPLVDLLLPDNPDCGNRPELDLTGVALMRTETLPSP
jgi:Flp pilus assembly protein TadG